VEKTFNGHAPFKGPIPLIGTGARCPEDVTRNNNPMAGCRFY
jgi:hypothetical protein